MRRKIILTVLAMTLILVSGCGSREAAVETEQETINAEETGTAENIESEKKEEVISESETDQEEIEHEESIPSWYMDSEGIKSDALGLIIRKDNTVLDEMCLGAQFDIFTPDDSGTGGRYESLSFQCEYYSGDLDDYISEHFGMERGEFGNIDCAYGGTDSFTEIAFVGNGVVIYLVYKIDMGENESLNDYLSRTNLIKAFDEPSVNCLAYIADDGLYCPALGIKLSTEESEWNIAGIDVSYWVYNDSVAVNISDESVGGKLYYMVDASNAQEVVDRYVEGAIESNTVKSTAIEGTVELNLGKYSYLGRGVIEERDWLNIEEWLFYSDELTWSIRVAFAQGNQYEDYIGAIESLN